MSLGITIYRIWRRGWITSGGFLEYYDEPISRIFILREQAEANLPKDINELGVSWEFYIKEEVIDD